MPWEKIYNMVADDAVAHPDAPASQQAAAEYVDMSVDAAVLQHQPRPPFGQQRTPGSSSQALQASGADCGAPASSRDEEEISSLRLRSQVLRPRPRLRRSGHRRRRKMGMVT